MLQAVDRLVINDPTNGIEISRGGGQEVDDQARKVCLLIHVWISASTIHPDIWTSDLSGLGFNASVASERPTTTAPKLIPELGEHVDNNIIMHIFRAGHHPEGKPVDKLIPI
jgi:hypothetical protein